MLDLKLCYNDQKTKDINEDKLEKWVRAFNPHLVVISICHSQVSKVKVMLEKPGVFAEIRMRRNLIEVTDGKVIDLDENQINLIHEVANPKNINKNVVIQGPEGSGKTLLGIEIVKLIAHNYIHSENLSPDQTKKDIRVIFSACFYQTEDVQDDVKLLVEQMESIVQKSLPCSGTFQKIASKKENNPIDYKKQILNLIRRSGRSSFNFSSFKKTIIMIDEVRPGFETTEWNFYKQLQSTGVNNVQVVFCLKYDFHDMKIRNERDKDDQSPYDPKNILDLENVLIGRLHKAHRCSNEIRSFVYYLLMHEFGNKLHEFKSFQHDEPSFDAGKTPIWIETRNAKSFKALVLHNSRSEESTFYKSQGETVVLIYDPNTIEPQEQREVKGTCDEQGWQCFPKAEVVGTEFSFVIIYGLKEFHFEAFTRAMSRLIIVTTSSTQ